METCSSLPKRIDVSRSPGLHITPGLLSSVSSEPNAAHETNDEGPPRPRLSRFSRFSGHRVGPTHLLSVPASSGSRGARFDSCFFTRQSYFPWLDHFGLINGLINQLMWINMDGMIYIYIFICTYTWIDEDHHTSSSKGVLNGVPLSSTCWMGLDDHLFGTLGKFFPFLATSNSFRLYLGNPPGFQQVNPHPLQAAAVASSAPSRPKVAGFRVTGSGFQDPCPPRPFLLQPNGDGLQPISDGLQPNNDGLQT